METQDYTISLAHSSVPHNLTEVCNALIALLQKGSLTIDELLEYIPGPDFPCGGRTLNSRDVRVAFETGKSKVSLKVQGDYQIEGQKIIFTSIPYRTYRDKIKEQISKNVDTFSTVLDDYDDESNIGKTKLIFYVKDGVSVSSALDKLFTLTDLQSSVSYNMNFIVDGTPKLCSMMDLLKAYLNHREIVLIKATEFDKAKAEARAHILEGLIAAVDEIDEVIALIKQSSGKAEAREKLVSFLEVDEVQANAILDMKLGKLTRIDKEELINELKEKREFIAHCVEILTKKEVRNNELIAQIEKLRDTYGDARRTVLDNIEITKAKKEPVVVEPKDCVVVISRNGLAKRIDYKNFKPQKRATAGVKTNSDITVFSQKTNTQDYLMAFTTKGKVYRTLVDSIPEGTNTSSGSITMEFESDERPIAYTTLNRDTTKQYIFFATKNGVVKKVPIKEYEDLKRTGVIAIKFKEGDELAAVTLIDQEQIMILTKKGMSIRFETAEMPISSRIAQGVKGIKLDEGDYVVAAIPINNPDSFLAIVSESGVGKKTALKEFVTQGRGGKGVACYKGTIAGGVVLDEGELVLISGNKTSIVIDSKEIPTTGRIAAGNILLKNNDFVTSIAKV